MSRIYCYLFFITLFLFSQPSFGSTHSPATTLTLDQAVHFITSDGNNVVVQPGTYEVEGTDNKLRLIPEGEVTPILLSAQQTPFPEEVDAPIAMSIPLENEGVYIAWLQPGKKGMETIGSYSPVQKRGINLFNTPGKLTSQNIRQLKSFAKRLANDPNSKTLKNNWTQVVKDITRQKALRNSFNVNEVIMMVLRESIVNQNKDKQYWLKKLQTYNAMAKNLSQYLEDLHRKAKNLRGSEKVRIEQRIHTKEKELATMGDDAQLANLELQNAQQKMQQFIQMMSNISKQLHDTAKAIIRNLK